MTDTNRESKIETIRVFLMQKYGPVMNTNEVKEALKKSASTVLRIPMDRLPRKSQKKAGSTFLTMDVAAYMVHEVHGEEAGSAPAIEEGAH